MADQGTSSTFIAARKLADLLASVEVNANWPAVESNAQALANGLRTRDGPTDEHTALGKTLLPQTLASLMKAALNGPGTSDVQRGSAIFELLRVCANLCIDHDDNRGYLLDAGFPQLLATLLESYADVLPEISTLKPHPLPLSHLRIIKIAIGALINMSLGYEPVQTRLISLEIPLTLLRLSTSIFPPGAWHQSTGSLVEGTDHEGWVLREGIVQWSLRAIASLKDNKVNQPLFGPEALPSLVVPLKAFIPPFPERNDFFSSDQAILNSLYSTDVEILEEVSELIESSSLDVDDVRLALARGMAENAEPPCLSILLDFIESAEYIPGWKDENIPPDEVTRWKRAVDLCKTAAIKAVVEVTGDEDNIDTLWNVEKPENSLVPRFVKWLQKEHGKGKEDARDDILVCASLSLGNLVRRESYSISLVNPPTSISPYLVPYIAPDTDVKVKHGVIGLLKHLAQTPATRPILGEAGVIQALRTSQIFGERADFTEIVQMSAINLVKHLCTHNLENAIKCVLDMDEDDPRTSCINQILSRSRRSDTVSVKSEGARVLVNTVKSLCTSTGDVKEPNRQRACQLLATPECAEALAQLLGRSKKHIILLNEATISMLLLTHQPSAAPLVLTAITAKLPKEVTPSRQNSADSTVFNPSVPTLSLPDAPKETQETALDMLVFILDNPEGKYPAELRANVCTLLGELGKNVAGSQIRELARPTLEKVQTTPDSLVLSAAARKALEVW